MFFHFFSSRSALPFFLPPSLSIECTLFCPGASREISSHQYSADRASFLLINYCRLRNRSYQQRFIQSNCPTLVGAPLELEKKRFCLSEVRKLRFYLSFSCVPARLSLTDFWYLFFFIIALFPTLVSVFIFPDRKYERPEYFSFFIRKEASSPPPSTLHL